MCHFLVTTLTRAALVMLLLMTLALSVRAQQRPADQPAAEHTSATTSGTEDHERGARSHAERYTFDPETGTPRLTDGATAAFFGRHREAREAARPIDTLHPMRPGSASVIPPASNAQGGSTFTVNSAGDADDTNPGDGLCFTGFVFLHDGQLVSECTLRAAIEETNAAADDNPTQIDFDIVTGPAGSDLPDDVWMIRPATALPTVTHSNTTIDALTQPGASCGDLTSPDPGAPRHDLKVSLYGIDVPGSANGLVGSTGFGKENITFRGFVVGLFPGYGMVLGGGDSVAECNYVGADLPGEDEEYNHDGIYVGGGPGTTTGGLVQNNLVSGNDGNGVVISRNDVELRDNLIGTDANGTNPNANGIFNVDDLAGIQVSGHDVVIDGNVVSGNSGRGVRLASSLTLSGTQSAQRVELTNNIIGLSRFGTSNGLSNVRHGIQVVEGASGNDIGLPGQGNLVAGSGGGNWSGIVVSGTGTDNNRVRGNTVGLDVDGNTVPNYQGIFSGDDSDGSPDGTVIGGPDPGDRNIVGGNTRYGIYLLADTEGLVEGNTVGLNAASAARPNVEGGINLHSSEAPIVRDNTVSGNAGPGISLHVLSGPVTPTSSATIEDNRVGTNPAGDAPRPNGESGIALFNAVSTLIRNNTIAANTDAGIYLIGEPDDVRVQGNYIGTNAGSDALGNGLEGIYCHDATDSQIGSNSHGNVIAYNGGDGVFLNYNCQAINIIGNVLHSNGGLGIDLAPDGVNANDPGDADGGANGSLNYPVITSAENDGIEVVIEWTFSAERNESYSIRFCRNDSADPSGHGECEVLTAEEEDVETDGSGQASGTLTLPAATYPAGSWVTATASRYQDGYDPTSEFAAAVQVTGIMLPDYDLVATNISPLTVAPGGQVAFDYSVTNSTEAPVEGDLWFTVAPGGFASVIASGTVQAGQTVGGSFVQQVPGFAPPGDYTYTLHIGQYPVHSVDQEVFVATVSGATRESGSTNGSTDGSTTWSVIEAAPWTPAEDDLQAASHLDARPSQPTLSAAYPNPFSTRATLSFRLPERDRMRLVVYDMLGREVTRVVDGEVVEAGQHEAVLDGSELASGMYLVRLVVGEAVQTQRLTLVR